MKCHDARFIQLLMAFFFPFFSGFFVSLFCLFTPLSNKWYWCRTKEHTFSSIVFLYVYWFLFSFSMNDIQLNHKHHFYMISLRGIDSLPTPVQSALKKEVSLSRSFSLSRVVLRMGMINQPVFGIVVSFSNLWNVNKISMFEDFLYSTLNSTISDLNKAQCWCVVFLKIISGTISLLNLRKMMLCK